MEDRDLSRRRFIFKSCAGLGSAWIASHLPEIAAAQQHAHRAAQTQESAKFESFTKEQSIEVEAIAEQIIPTDDTPGAREARVVFFIDRAFATFASDERPAYMKGLSELQKKTQKRFGKARKFSDLTSAQQTQLLKSIEKTEFFELARTMTILGMFSNPEYGGNHNQAGWKLLGFEDQFHYKSPFGYYDAEYLANKGSQS
ncbi:MAG TPA: gluconate 2-dehydrogenase subunit 3 family protein [Blastocatellia bacterium]|nr:gluconate 2-dehydrogenase subunit 3 family protein [Blastocatellia bacterium]